MPDSINLLPWRLRARQQARVRACLWGIGALAAGSLSSVLVVVIFSYWCDYRTTALGQYSSVSEQDGIRLGEIMQIDRDHARLKELGQVLARYVNAQQQQLEVWDELSRAAEHGVTLERVGWQSARITLEVRGALDKVNRYIQALEALKYMSSIDLIEHRPDGSGGWSLLYLNLKKQNDGNTSQAQNNGGRLQRFNRQVRYETLS